VSASRLAREAERSRAQTLLARFAADPARAARFTFEGPHLTLDLSKQHIDTMLFDAFAELYATADLEGWRAKLFGGAAINNTEHRAARHWALRDLKGEPEVHAVRRRLRDFAREIADGGGFDAIIHLGIGGSDLGPRLVLDALKPYRRPGLQVRFAANVDGADVADAIEGLDPKRTLLIVASKTFTTQETLANAEFVRAWGPRRIAAATAAPGNAVAWGVAEADVFPFWDWVGGRYSLWSSVGLVCEIALRDGVFVPMLEGAAAMDSHFRDMPLQHNLPVLAASVQHWNRARGCGSYALIPYAERLRLLPAYLQQLEMESNGKRVSRDGAPLSAAAAGVTWGAAGANAQHSFFQLLHQGIDEIPVEFLIQARGGEGPPAHRPALLANALAQARALMTGKSEAQTKAEMLARGVNEAEATRLAPHRTFPGNRASTILAFDALTPEALGAMLAFYEHRTFVQGVLAGVNSFDQFGVELGKEMASALKPALEGAPAPEGLDGSTAAWLKRLSS